MPRSSLMPVIFSGDKPVAFAHRGGDERFPENTIEAFQDAYELGYRYFETDVHYTVDNELVAFHDNDLQRTLGRAGTIASMTKAERLGGKYRIPLLSDLMDRFPDVYFNIDAKSQAAVEPLAKTVQKYEAFDRVCLASFSDRNIRSLRRLLPGVATMAMLPEVAGLRVSSALARLQSGETRYLELPEHFFHERRMVRIVNRKFVDRLHKDNHKIFIWTVNDPKEMHRLLDMGVDGLFTDKLRVMKQVLIDRGQWDS